MGPLQRMVAPAGVTLAKIVAEVLIQLIAPLDAAVITGGILLEVTAVIVVVTQVVTVSINVKI